MKSWEKVWFRTDCPFPREVTLKRILALDYDKFDELRRRSGVVDVYSSLFSVAQLEEEQLDTIFLDIDGSVREAYNNMCIVQSSITNKLDYIPRVYFSGRGYHIYIDIEPIGIQEWRSLSNYIVDGLGIRPYVDRAIIGNPRALARVPGTRNSKTGLWMVCICPLDTFDDVMVRGRKGIQCRVEKVKGLNDVITVESIKNAIGTIRPFSGTQGRFVGERLTIEAIEREHYTAQTSIDSNEIPPCVQSLLDEMEISGEMDHERRVFIASVLLRMENMDDVHCKFTVASDYDPKIVDYQLEHIKSRGYTPARCVRIEGWGVCPGRCRYYPSIGRKLNVNSNIELSGMDLGEQQSTGEDISPGEGDND